MLEKPT